MGDPAFFPLQQVPTFATANIKSYAFWWTRSQVSTNQNTLHPVVKVSHQFDGTLRRELEGDKGKRRAINFATSCTNTTHLIPSVNIRSSQVIIKHCHIRTLSKIFSKKQKLMQISIKFIKMATMLAIWLRQGPI